MGFIVALIAAGTGALFLKIKGSDPVSRSQDTLIDGAPIKVAPKVTVANNSIIVALQKSGFSLTTAIQEAAQSKPARDSWAMFKKYREYCRDRDYANKHYWEAYWAIGRVSEEKRFKTDEENAIRKINELFTVTDNNPIVRSYFIQSGGLSLREYMFGELEDYLASVEHYESATAQMNIPFEVYLRAYKNLYSDMLKNPPTELSDKVADWGTKLAIIIGAAYGANDGSALMK